MAKILLLEDDDTITFGIKTSLEKKNHTVCCYNTIVIAVWLLSNFIECRKCLFMGVSRVL